MKHSVSFDIDGTLIDTKQLNRDAYYQVGVDVPDYAFGLRWQTWLPNVVGSMSKAEEIHTRKVRIYIAKLRDVNINHYILEPTYLARSLLRRTDIEVKFLTSGTVTTANIILQRLNIRAPLAGNLSYEARRLLLHSSVLGTNGSVVYIDDLADNVRRLTDDVLGLTAIQFIDQDNDTLRNQVQEALKRGHA